MTATKEISRAKILDYLKKATERNDLILNDAKEYIEKYGNNKMYEQSIKENYEPIIKYRVYTPIDELSDAIIEAMGFIPVEVQTYTKYRNYIVRGRLKSEKITTHLPIYSDKDNETVKTIIERMSQQGFIRISKKGRHFKVLKSR